VYLLQTTPGGAGELEQQGRRLPLTLRPHRFGATHIGTNQDAKLVGAAAGATRLRQTHRAELVILPIGEPAQGSLYFSRIGFDRIYIVCRRLGWQVQIGTDKDAHGATGTPRRLETEVHQLRQRVESGRLVCNGSFHR
jgi:hypothetical protein